MDVHFPTVVAQLLHSRSCLGNSLSPSDLSPAVSLRRIRLVIHAGCTKRYKCHGKNSMSDGMGIK